MESRRLPIRTYQRKTVKKPCVNLLTFPIQPLKKYNLVVNVQKYSNQSATSNESLNYDPFETTFDRIAKGAVVPPLPPDVNQNNSWNGSSSNSDTTNITNTSTKSEYDEFTYNSTYSSMHKNIKLPCRKLQKYELTGVTMEETSKKTKVISTKIQIQGKKKQTSKVQKRKKIIHSKFRESSRKNVYIKQQSKCSNCHVTNSLKDITCGNVSRSDDIKHSPEKSLKTDKMMLQATLDNFVTDLKYMSNYCQYIKPCFVKLSDCTTQNWYTQMGVVNKKSIDKQNMLYDIKHLEMDKDISEKVHNSVSKSISIDYNDRNVDGNFKNMSLKSCSVVLCDNIVQNCSTESIKLHTHDNCNDSIVSPLIFHDLSNTTSHRNHNLAICNTNGKQKKQKKTKENKRKIIKDSFVKLERLKVEEFVKRNNVTFNEKKRYMVICSTPIGKCTRPTYSIFSPIDTKDASYLKQNCSMMTKEENIILPSEHPNKKIRLSISQREDYKFNNADMQEQQTQLLLSQNMQNTAENLAVKTDTMISPKENIHTALTQKYNMVHDIEMALLCSSNTSIGTDQSQSLFDDMTTSNCNHSTQDAAGKEKIDEMTCMSLQNINNITNMKEGNVVFLEDSKKRFKTELTMANDKCNLLLSDDQSNTDIFNIDGLLPQVQHLSRITTRRTRYPELQHFNMLNTFETSNHENMQSNNEIFDYIASNGDSSLHQQSEVNNLEYSDNTNRQKSIFLKSGKSWIRSLSILNNINDGCNLDKLSIGKGRNWRNSVRNLLDMQKQGILESCCKEEKDGSDLLSTEFDVSNILSFDISKHKTLNSTNHIRFFKRISVRVVPNETSTKHDVTDTQFLEVFGISAENSSNSKLSYQTQLTTRDYLISKHSLTAKDVVFKKCSQERYLSFSECFPDSYLEYCRKIGEGVYGEVFLYDYNNKKSVIKIIPIEGKELVNGEPQKKFNEILSEIVIAKELDNLRLNNVYNTKGFIEVKSIKCIIGRYPEKLVKLWNIYDEEKMSDNDCPSLFDENQLYIALELDHGGEDLEAFVFQTAEEACALFLQITLTLAVAEKAFEFEHRDLHWGNVLISRTKNKYVYYTLDKKEIRLPSNGVKVSIIDFTLSRMLYQDCCIYNDLALDPTLFTAHGEYQFDIYRLMRDKIQNNWQKFEPYTNILWLHYILDKMITMVRYKRKNLKVHKQALIRLKELKDSILNYNSTYEFVTNSDYVAYF